VANTVVVVDDNPQIREVVRRALAAAGFAVLDWANPEAAVDYLSDHDDPVSLVIVDGVMPQMTGPVAAIQIREKRPDVPILLMSGHEAPMFADFFGRPGHHYIAKPFVVEDLVSRVRSLTGRLG
jgi:two-component system cell cycle sensor histidine kinase/response regulator CckA